MPAEAPSAKRQRIPGSAEPTGACARAHAFVPDSPLSPSKVLASGSPGVSEHNPEIVAQPVESPDASGGEEASFAVRSDSELEPAHASPQQAIEAAAEVPVIRAATEDGLHKAHTSSRPPDSGNDPDSQSVGPEATSQQQSVAGPDASAPSTTSYETNMLPAAAKSEVDSPISPQMLEDHTEAPAGETAAAMAESQAVTSPAVAGHITVSQLLLAGPYQVDAEQQATVAHNLKTYKAKVDEVHALGKVSWNMRYHQTEFIVKPAAIALPCTHAWVWSCCTAHAGSCISSAFTTCSESQT